MRAGTALFTDDVVVVRVAVRALFSRLIKIFTTFAFITSGWSFKRAIFASSNSAIRTNGEPFDRLLVSTWLRIERELNKDESYQRHEQPSESSAHEFLGEPLPSLLLVIKANSVKTTLAKVI